MDVLRRLLRPRGERGQIVIPAIFFFPTLFLFVFLLFETSKLSREKIRRQFAVDAAAFVEMTSYSDFLNRSAYVNGPFPMRIMREGFRETMQNCQFLDPCPRSEGSDTLMWQSGAFPRDSRYDGESGIPSSEKNWQIEYHSVRPNMNVAEPSMDSWDTASPLVDQGFTPCEGECGLIFTKLMVYRKYNINWEDATTIFKMYVQIYQLLGSVESAQFSVLKKLTKDSGHNFLSKSYWLNTGQTNINLNEGKEGVKSIVDAGADDFISDVSFLCMPKMRVYGKYFAGGLGGPQVKSETYPMPKTIPDCKNADGLFQLVTVKPRAIAGMRKDVSDSIGSYGWPVTIPWTAPENYFGVDVNQQMRNVDQGPKVHASVSMFVGTSNQEGVKASVWPYPQPKFQTRLYP